MVDKITVLYFGMYDPEYSRNRILIDGLRQNGVEVIECRDDSPGLKKFLILFLKHWKLRKDYDVMIVGFLGQLIMPFARFINLPFVSFRPSRPIVFDAFLSLYDSNVFGREVVRPRSLKAFYYWLLDWFSMHLGDIVLFDTQEHIEYVSKEFGIKKNKLARIFVGAQEDIFHPQGEEASDSAFQVLFHGTFIKSQGIEYILKAAKILEQYGDIRFIFIGSGQVKKEMTELAKNIGLKNVDFLGTMSLSEIPSHIAKASVCLGIFGKAPKIQRVIPNKVFECVAMKKAMITADTPGIRELFGDSELSLIPIADVKAIAGAILKLKNDANLREKLADNAFNKFKKYASIFVLGGELKDIVVGLLKIV